jgi:hypothetical protein
MQSNFWKCLGIITISSIFWFTPAVMRAHQHHECGHPPCEHFGCNHHDCGECFLAAQKLTPTTFQGKVTKVQLSQGRPLSSVELITEQGEKRTIHIAPAWFLKDQDFDLYVGQQLTIEVSKIDCPQGPHWAALMLRTVEGKEFRVRDARGAPLWQRGHAHGCCHGE